ncbi:RNA methyltransferase [Nitzschia inconspicua]|uniref:rRNA methyltransferase 1, mitochondrial n=1 Tax=Nitzschia inconspicua TaxID=303405 RepID=A0A9K3LHW7_9STRA|nr:RNA methyltransferase [Nitzschia inconspicua]KAG7362675.1 RNA methyltransferase [Nitzschia inconspicua]
MTARASITITAAAAAVPRRSFWMVAAFAMMLTASHRAVAFRCLQSTARIHRTNSDRRVQTMMILRLRSTNSRNNADDATFVDQSGRRIRSRGDVGGGWNNENEQSSDYRSNDNNDDDDGWGVSSSSSSRKTVKRRTPTSTWEDFDPWQGGSSVDDNDTGGWNTPASRPSRRQPKQDGPSRNRFDRDSRRFKQNNNDRPFEKKFPKSPRNKINSSMNKFGRKVDGKDTSGVRTINMNALEGAGFVHLYGISSVLNALSSNKRDLSINVEKTSGEYDLDDDDDPRFQRNSDTEWDDNDDDSDAGSMPKPPDGDIKPQARFRSYLFVQERQRDTGRKGNKATAAQQVLELAEQRGVPIAHVDKGILNTLSGNRPHQGFVLRCGKLYFEGMSRIPLPSENTLTPSVWLVLDEVVDPQNLGALLRSAYFLGGGNSDDTKIGVLVCSKNSAPPSPVVSASSAGALELLDVYSTNNLPRTLNQASEDGFRIIGASSSVPMGSNDEGDDADQGPALYDLQDLPSPKEDDRPTILVLGSEGHGLRTLVAKACTEFVRIPSGKTESHEDDDESNVGVDSLNVSVTGGILLWHLLHGTARL